MFGFYVLQATERGVEFVAENEAFVFADGLYFALVHDDDVRVVPDGGDTVGDGDDDSFFADCVYGFLYVSFADCVEGGGGFVEYEYVCVPQYGSCYGEALFLSSREGATAFSYDGVVAVFEFFDELVGFGCLGCGFYVLYVAIRIGESEVVRHRVVEEYGVLRDHCYVSSYFVFA